ncbi:uncharacterized protein AB9X84_015941 [Acanthopagrus schlegelii]
MCSHCGFLKRKINCVKLNVLHLESQHFSLNLFIPSQSGGNKAQVQSVPLSKWPEMLRQFQEKLQKKITESNDKQAEVQQLQEQIQKMKTGLQTLMKDLDSDTLEVHVCNFTLL